MLHGASGLAEDQHSSCSVAVRPYHCFVMLSKAVLLRMRSLSFVVPHPPVSAHFEANGSVANLGLFVTGRGGISYSLSTVRNCGFLAGDLPLVLLFGCGTGLDETHTDDVDLVGVIGGLELRGLCNR